MPINNLRPLATLLCAGSLLTGCMVAPGMTAEEKEVKTSLSSTASMPATRTMRDNIETQELFVQAAFWSREYDLNPSDLEATIKLASSVRKLGNASRAVEITQMGRSLYPRDPYLGAEYAAALISSERADEAQPILDEMLRVAPSYARLWSLKGAALDQQEQYDTARKHYARAMQITPHDPNILTNIGLSYALSGDAPTAEGWLRRAASMPGASSAVKQNLALVLRLQGKTAEADKIAGVESEVPALSYPQVAARPEIPQQSYNQGYRQPSPSAGNYGSPYTSASDAARAAAARAGQRSTQDIIPQQRIKEQQDVLAAIAQRNRPGGYPAQQPRPQAQYQAQPQYAPQTQQPQPGYPQAYGAMRAPNPQQGGTYMQPQERRSRARLRR